MWLHLILQQLSEVVVLFLFIEAEINLTTAPGYYPGSAIYQLCAPGDTSSLSGPVIFLVPPRALKTTTAFPLRIFLSPSSTSPAIFNVFHGTVVKGTGSRFRITRVCP